MDLTFFGLTPDNAPEARIGIFRTIHSMIFHSKGGYDFNTIYNMPIWLRKFTFSEINNYYKEEQKQYDDAKNGGKGNQTLVSSDGTINTPEFLKNSQLYKGKTSYK